MKSVKTTQKNEKVLLKLKGLGAKDHHPRKTGGAKGDKAVVCGSMGILGLKMNTKMDSETLAKLNIGTYEKDAEQRVTK